MLGTIALDHASGYVGQSRGRQPTHTWNVAPERAEDHGRHLAGHRSAAEQVHDALARQPDHTFAARDDPWLLDRVLSAERAEHQRIIATRPPFDPRRARTRRREPKPRAESELDGARAFHDGATQRLHDIGGIARLRRTGREAHAHTEAEVRRTTQWLRAAERAHAIAESTFGEHEHDAAAREAWDHEHGWRLERVTDIRRELRQYWANAVLDAARNGDALAYGPEQLPRRTRATFDAELRQLARPSARRTSVTAANDLAGLRDAVRLLSAAQPAPAAYTASARNATHAAPLGLPDSRRTVLKTAPGLDVDVGLEL